MIVGTSNAAQSQSLSAKDTRRKFGTRRAPLLVAATATAYRRVMNFDEQFAGKIVTRSWVVIDPKSGLLIRTNTYDGNVGKNADLLNPAYCTPIPPEDSKDRKRALKGYEPVSLDEVPFVLAPAPEAKSTSKIEDEDTESTESEDTESEESDEAPEPEEHEAEQA